MNKEVANSVARC